MNPFTMNQSSQNPDPGCTGAMTMAERELAAFFRAVTELLGPEMAKLSAEAWLRELSAAERLPNSAREWRRITLNVSTGLAARVNASSISSVSPALA